VKRLIAIGGTHVGRVRSGNEDALLVRTSVFAVADGMGGHRAGEVASATALEPIAELDGRVFPDAITATRALRTAVREANARVVQLADANPEYRGMGTTLTAAMLEGRRLHVAHVGDSRAYLLRGGAFSQLTDDHTLVQSLIDDGQITPEEAEQHPHRSVITRAIGVAPEVEVDSMTLDLEPDDQVLLCSDGLTGVVRDVTIATTLAARQDPETTIARLIDLANEGGGPDNVTVLLLRYEDLAPASDHASSPASRSSTIPIDTRAVGAADDVVPGGPDAGWARRFDRLGADRTPGAGGVFVPRPPEPRGRIIARGLAILLGVVLIVSIVVGGARFLLDRSYYVGVDEGELVVYQGITWDLGPIPLSRVLERTGVMLVDIPIYLRPAFEDGRPAVDLADARRMVSGTPRTARTDGDGAGTAPSP
jgi:PPM family protein phosphatase